MGVKLIDRNKIEQLIRVRQDAGCSRPEKGAP